MDRLKLVLPRVSFGYGGEKSVIQQTRFVRIRTRVDAVSEDHLATVAPIESDRHGNDDLAPISANRDLAVCDSEF
jgi:hypothetical protein